MRTALLLAAVLAIAGCKTDTAEGVSGLDAGARWAVVEIAGAPVPEGVSVTIEVAEPGVIAGSSGCNRYNGRFDTTGEAISFGALAGTRMMCPPERMQVEQAFHSHIGRVSRIGLEKGQLVMFQGDTPVIRANPQ